MRHFKLAFAPVDPLSDGLGDMIKQEIRESNGVDMLSEDYDAGAGQFWSAVELDMHSGNLVSFSED